MMKLFKILSNGILLCFMMTACSRFSTAASASAELFNPEGEKKGTVTFSQGDEGVRMNLRVEGLTPGAHGIHIHAVGKCEGPDFASAGPHFNPSNKKHGLKNPEGSHAGDLPNLEAGTEGFAEAEMTLPHATLEEGAENSLLKTEGTAVVIHAGPDDEATDPSGNSGGRILCGVIKKA